MNAATHIHRAKAFDRFIYRVTSKGVFCLRGSEWIKSSVTVKELRPIGKSVEELKKEESDKVLISEHCKTGEMTFFKSVKEAVKAGFEKAAVYRCLAGTQKTYKKCEWRWSE